MCVLLRFYIFETDQNWQAFGGPTYTEEEQEVMLLEKIKQKKVSAITCFAPVWSIGILIFAVFVLEKEAQGREGCGVAAVEG